MIRWTDSHAHCDVYNDSDLGAALLRAKEAGVIRILNAATSLTSCRTVVRQCARFDCLVGAVGISPQDVSAASDSWEEELCALAKTSRIVAIGETGIDATKPSYPSFDMQVSFFERHCVLAQRLGLPVIVHSRGCERRALDICASIGVARAVFHCYTGALDTMEKIVDAGYFVSFSGIVTFNRSPLATLAAAVPLESMLIETDTPYLAPVPHRGGPNQPAWVVHVGEKIAEIRGQEPGILARAMEENFNRAFG